MLINLFCSNQMNNDTYAAIVDFLDETIEYVDSIQPEYRSVEEWHFIKRAIEIKKMMRKPISGDC